MTLGGSEKRATSRESYALTVYANTATSKSKTPCGSPRVAPGRTRNR